MAIVHHANRLYFAFFDFYSIPSDIIIAIFTDYIEIITICFVRIARPANILIPAVTYHVLEHRICLQTVHMKRVSTEQLPKTFLTQLFWESMMINNLHQTRKLMVKLNLDYRKS